MEIHHFVRDDVLTLMAVKRSLDAVQRSLDAVQRSLDAVQRNQGFTVQRKDQLIHNRCCPSMAN